MLFNSYPFIFGFLPIAWVVFWALKSRGFERAAIGWVCLASLYFYAWWDYRNLFLVLASIAFNYSWARVHPRIPTQGGRRAFVAFGISANLALLAYYKYADFFLENVNALTGSNFSLLRIVLPLGISFFTFQQIGFIVDLHKGRARVYNLLDYVFFITFFPHLVAGPVVLHSQLIPQLKRNLGRVPGAFDVSLGLTIFAVGLAKKTVFADNVAVYANTFFENAATGGPIETASAWAGALAYTLQLYFDFSGYSDMAIGLGRMFGFDIPINFDSPYKAANIADFWRRWHISLSGFLRDYLYIPLGGNRHGPTRRWINLMVTMLLGGLWHGANWTFLLWGGLHGLYLVIHQFWRKITGGRFDGVPGLGIAGRGVTLLAVVAGWVLFRSDSLSTAVRVWKSMLSLSSESGSLAATDVPITAWVMIGLLLVIAFFFPNTRQMFLYRDEGERLWRPNLRWAAFAAIASVIAIVSISALSPFIYFQF